jgi:quinol monooxygenase YgiN
MTVTMFWSYRVPDFERWAAGIRFLNDQDLDARERRARYGMLRRAVYRSVDDPQEVTLMAQFQSRAGAEELLKDPEGMRRWHERTGVEAFPPVLITEELEELQWKG